MPQVPSLEYVWQSVRRNLRNSWELNKHLHHAQENAPSRTDFQAIFLATAECTDATRWVYREMSTVLFYYDFSVMCSLLRVGEKTTVNQPERMFVGVLYGTSYVETNRVEYSKQAKTIPYVIG